MWAGILFASALMSQETAIQGGAVRAVSPLTTTYAGRCPSGPFEVTLHRRTVTGERAHLRLTATCGGAEADLSDTPLTADLSREGAFLNSGFVCGAEHLTWYIWVVQVNPDGRPSYSSGQAVLGPDGRLESYTGLHEDDPEMLAASSL